MLLRTIWLCALVLLAFATKMESRSITISVDAKRKVLNSSVARNMIGLSIETASARVMFSEDGSKSCAGMIPRRSLIYLIQNLYGIYPKGKDIRKPFTIRLGGNSADESCYRQSSTGNYSSGNNSSHALKRRHAKCNVN